MEVKEQRPWFVVLLGTADEWKLFDIEVGQAHSRLNALKQRETRIKDVPFQVIKCKVGDPNKILARILNVTKHELLAKKTILIVGLGSGGSTLAKYLGCTGIGRIILVDSENLETVNIIRHEGGINDIGKPKTQVCKQVIESHNPFTIVEAHSFDVVKEFDRLEELALQSDLIIGSSGSNKVNNLLNKISIERRIPAIYGGVYEKALGGYVLAVKPFETACYNCLFNLTSRSYFVEREAAESYGLNEEELHEQQGLWIDISFPALILAKIALAMLEGKQMDYNLVLYDSSLEIRKLKVARRDDCAACNQEEWIRRKQAKKKKVSLKERIRRLIKWKA
jgi:molybdopterin/thiamine biosynthesis adenylyltransferase